MFKTTTKKIVLLIGDVVVLYAGLWITLNVRYKLPFLNGKEPKNAWELHQFPFFLVFLLWLFIFYSAGMYDWERLGNKIRPIIQITLKPLVIGSVLAVLLFYFIPSFNNSAFKITPKTNLVILSAISVFFLSLLRIIFINISAKGTKIPILFLGFTNETIRFANYIDKHPSLGYRTQLVIGYDQLKEQNIKKLISAHNINLIITEPSVLANQELVQTFYEILPFGVSIVNFPDFYSSITGKIPTYLINKTWFLENLIELNKRTFETGKRISDILFAIILAMPALLLFVPIALGIILSTPLDILKYKQQKARDGDGIIFFRQKRVGKNGKIFNFIKFRSQVLGAEKMGDFKNLNDKNDPRQYLFGKFLRKIYLDELPQLWNVLKGEMSLVGPRPERPEYVEKLKLQIPFYEIRLLVKPGITGWAQINMRDDASVEDAPEKLQYDLYYIKNRSAITDLAIMAKTASILARRGGR